MVNSGFNCRIEEQALNDGNEGIMVKKNRSFTLNTLEVL